jgi:hypothetical protein
MTASDDEKIIKYVKDTFKQAINDDKKFMKGINSTIIKQRARLNVLLDVQANLKNNSVFKNF